MQMVVFLRPRHVLGRFMAKHVSKYRNDWAMTEKALSSHTNMTVGAEYGVQTKTHTHTNTHTNTHTHTNADKQTTNIT